MNFGTFGQVAEEVHSYIRRMKTETLLRQKMVEGMESVLSLLGNGRRLGGGRQLGQCARAGMSATVKTIISSFGASLEDSGDLMSLDSRRILCRFWFCHLGRQALVSPRHCLAPRCWLDRAWPRSWIGQVPRELGHLKESCLPAQVASAMPGYMISPTPARKRLVLRLLLAAEGQGELAVCSCCNLRATR